MTPCCTIPNCFDEAEFDSIFAGGGMLCTKHAALEVEDAH